MSDPSRNELLFLELVAMFQFAAMQHMGKVANPVTGKIEVNLEQARISIDIVEMLYARTDGRRSDRESEFLDKVLFELRMNYVDEVKRNAASPQDGTDGSTESPPDSSPEAS
jgi:Domain of unknown function (DUF1844)